MARLQCRKENGEASTGPLSHQRVSSSVGLIRKFDPIKILFSLAFLSTSLAD